MHQNPRRFKPIHRRLDDAHVQTGLLADLNFDLSNPWCDLETGKSAKILNLTPHKHVQWKCLNAQTNQK